MALVIVSLHIYISVGLIENHILILKVIGGTLGAQSTRQKAKREHPFDR
jgi:hypothetical protein